jgi:hypothetical protein
MHLRLYKHEKNPPAMREDPLHSAKIVNLSYKLMRAPKLCTPLKGLVAL